MATKAVRAVASIGGAGRQWWWWCCCCHLSHLTTHKKKAHPARQMKQQHLCANCVTRNSGGRWVFQLSQGAGQVREFVLMTDTQVFVVVVVVAVAAVALHSRLLLVLLLIYFVAAPTPCSLACNRNLRWGKANWWPCHQEKMQSWEMENRASVAVCQLAHVVLVLRCCNLESFLLTMLPPGCPPSAPKILAK